MQQTKQVVSFTLRNPLDKVIDLKQIQANCTCTSQKVAKMHLLPGEETTLEATLRVGNARGELISFIDVLYSVDSGSVLQKLQLQIKASVQPHYNINPSTHEFLIEKSSDILHAQNTLTPLQGPSVKLLAAIPENPAIKILAIRNCNETGTASVEYSYHSSRDHLKSSSGKIWLQTDSQLDPQYCFRYYVKSK